MRLTPLEMDTEVNLEAIKQLFGMFKLKEMKNCWQGIFNSALKQKQDSSASTFDTGKNMYPFLFISWFVSFGVSICLQCFSDVVRNQTYMKLISTTVNQKKIKNSWKEYET